jgi:hypothetical protein
MLTPKQNFLETVNQDGKPDRLVKQFEKCEFFRSDPVAIYARGIRYKGMPPLKDKWGTTVLWPETQVAAMPHVTSENKVIPDIITWREKAKVPDLIGNCSDPELWAPALKEVSKVDRKEKFLMAYMPTGVFEQLHFLMGFEDTLMNFLEEPEAMHDLCAAVGEYRFNYMKLLVDNLKPDIMLSHDDWGSKKSLFTSPGVWREFIKPQYVKTYGYMKEKGVIIMHHADSYLEPIVEDMVDLGIDIWQGVLPQNDIPKIQKQLAGRMVLMGGIDASIVDRVDTAKEVIREEVRRACTAYAPGGKFIPCITYGGPGTIFPHVDPIIDEEIDTYNREVYGI